MPLPSTVFFAKTRRVRQPRRPPAGSRGVLVKLGAIPLPANMRPQCPKCSLRMIVQLKKDRSRAFWGCVTYPRCNAIRAINRARFDAYCLDHELPNPLTPTNNPAPRRQ